MKPLTLAKLFIVSLFIPGEFYLDLGGLRIEIYRIILGVSLFSTLVLLAKKPVKLQITDKGIIAATLVGIISLIYNHGFLSGLEKAGIFSFEIFGSFFLARQAITSEKNLLVVYKTLGIMVTIFFIPALIEMFTGYKVVHELAKAITGNDILGQALYGEKYIRAGLTRSTSAFSHPILNGTICAAAIPFACYLVIRYRKPKYLVMFVSAILCVFSSLSSAPLLIIVVQISVIFFIQVKKVLKRNIRYFMLAFAAIAFVIHLVSNRGIIKIIIQTATFNPHTGTHRLLIIEHIQDDIMRSPIFGSGIGAYWSAPGWMGQSIDNFWLAIAFTYGIPFAVLIGAISIYSVFKINVSIVPKKIDYLSYAMKSSVLSMVILGITVHLFGKINPLFYFILGSSVFLFSKRPTKEKKTMSHVDTQVEEFKE